MKHELKSADFPHGGGWNELAIPPRGRRLVIGGVNNERKGSVEIWDFAPGAEAN